MVGARTVGPGVIHRRGDAWQGYREPRTARWLHLSQCGRRCPEHGRGMMLGVEDYVTRAGFRAREWHQHDVSNPP